MIFSTLSVDLRDVGADCRSFNMRHQSAQVQNADDKRKAEDDPRNVMDCVAMFGSH